MSADPFRVHVRGNMYTNPNTGARWTEVPNGRGGVIRTYQDAPIRYGAGPPMGVSAPVVQAVTTKPAAPPKPKPLEPIRRQTGDARVELRLLPSVVESIRRTVFWDNVGQETTEVGGWLAGGWDGRALTITKATSSAEDRTPTSAKLGVADFLSLEWLKSRNDGLGCTGSWHLHPGGGLEASPTDFRSAELVHKYLNEERGAWVPYVCQIIVAPNNSRSLTDIAARAWVTCKQDGRYVTEPTRWTVI